MIQSFKCGDSEALHHRHRVARWVNIEAAARRKLDQLDAASELRDMAAPPGNRLEALSATAQGNTASASTTNSASVLYGRRKAQKTWKLWITTKGARR